MRVHQREMGRWVGDLGGRVGDRIEWGRRGDVGEMEVRSRLGGRNTATKCQAWELPVGCSSPDLKPNPDVLLSVSVWSQLPLLPHTAQNYMEGLQARHLWLQRGSPMVSVIC